MGISAAAEQSCIRAMQQLQLQQQQHASSLPYQQQAEGIPAAAQQHSAYPSAPPIPSQPQQQQQQAPAYQGLKQQSAFAAVPSPQASCGQPSSCNSTMSNSYSGFNGHPSAAAQGSSSFHGSPFASGSFNSCSEQSFTAAAAPAGATTAPVPGMYQQIPVQQPSLQQQQQQQPYAQQPYAQQPYASPQQPQSPYAQQYPQQQQPPYQQLYQQQPYPQQQQQQQYPQQQLEQVHQGPYAQQPCPQQPYPQQQQQGQGLLPYPAVPLPLPLPFNAPPEKVHNGYDVMVYILQVGVLVSLE
jgi:hypothetical protein